MIDILDIRKAVKDKQIYFSIENGWLFCSDLFSNEKVIVQNRMYGEDELKDILRVAELMRGNNNG